MKRRTHRLPTVGLLLVWASTMTSCLDDVTMTSDNVTADLFATKVRESHHRYCGSNRVCQGYHPSRCISCEPCKCDSDCHQYGDCCPDVAFLPPSHVGSNAVVPNNQSCVGELFGGSRLRGQLAERTEVKRYFMVTQCPSLIADAASMCANLTSLPPVTSTTDGITYRNAFCAQCHGVTTFDTWKVKVDCAEHKDVLTLNSMEAVIQAALNDSYCMVYYVPPTDVTPRLCFHDDSVITSCNVTGQWPQYDAFLERACTAYTTVKDINGTLYRNVFCYICNSAAPTLFEVCKKTKHGLPMSFSALLDFMGPEGPPSTPARRCPQDAIFDPDREVCRPILCERGKQLKDGRCDPIFPVSKGIGYELYFRLLSDTPLPLFGNEDIMRFVSIALEGYFQDKVLQGDASFNNVVLSSNTTVQPDGTCAVETRDLSMYVTMVTWKTVNQTEFESRLLEIRAGRSYSVLLDNVNVIFTTSPDKDARVLGQPTFASRSHPGSCRVSFQRTHPIPSYSPGNQSELAAEMSFIRVSDLLACPHIRLFPDEFRLSEENQTLSVAWLDEPLNETDYEQDGDQNVRICLHYFRPERLQAALKKGSSSLPEVIVSIVCISVSLLCLALTFAAYCALGALRSLPGKNNMNLTFTLFCAQILYVTGSGLTEVRGVCEAMGILIHYWWLAAFCAMNVCAWHMFRVFGALRQREEECEGRRRFLQYSVYIYGMPVLIVLVTLIAHIVATEGAAIGYGGRTCYLSSVIAVGLAFALPVAVIVIVNIVFFVVTVRVIKTSPKVEKSRQDEGHALVYIKLSSLTGLTWTLGFVAIVTRLAVLNYLFVVVNASQGVFIFFSFVWNARVRKLLCASMRGRRGSSTGTSGSSSNTTKSTTQGSAYTIKA